MRDLTPLAPLQKPGIILSPVPDAILRAEALWAIGVRPEGHDGPGWLVGAEHSLSVYPACAHLAAPTPQSGELPAHAGSAGRDGTLVAEHASREGREDRCEGDRTCPLDGVPDGRGGGSARPLRPHPGDDRHAS